MSEEYKNEYEKLWEEWLPRLKDYSNNRLELLKLTLVEAIAKMTAAATANLLLFLCFFAFLVFISLGLALYIGHVLGAYYLGFILIAGFYLLLFLVILVFRKSMIEKPIINQTIKKILEDEHEN